MKTYARPGRRAIRQVSAHRVSANLCQAAAALSMPGLLFTRCQSLSRPCIPHLPGYFLPDTTIMTITGWVIDAGCGDIRVPTRRGAMGVGGPPRPKWAGHAGPEFSRAFSAPSRQRSGGAARRPTPPDIAPWRALPHPFYSSVGVCRKSSPPWVSRAWSGGDGGETRRPATPGRRGRLGQRCDRACTRCRPFILGRTRCWHAGWLSALDTHAPGAGPGGWASPATWSPAPVHPQVRRAEWERGASSSCTAGRSGGRTRTSRSPTSAPSGRSRSRVPPTPRASCWRRCAWRQRLVF